MLSLGDEDRPRVLRAFGAGGIETSGLRMKISDSGLRAPGFGFSMVLVVVSYSDYDSV